MWGALLIGASAIVYEVTPRRYNPKIDPTDLVQVERGRRIYAEACASCHGAELQGQPNWQQALPNGRYPAPPLNGDGRLWRLSDRMSFAIVKQGAAAYPWGRKTDMPAFDKVLDDEQIAAALAYVESNWSKEQLSRHFARNMSYWLRENH